MAICEIVRGLRDSELPDEPTVPRTSDPVALRSFGHEPVQTKQIGKKRVDKPPKRVDKPQWEVGASFKLNRSTGQYEMTVFEEPAASKLIG